MQVSVSYKKIDNFPEIFTALVQIYWANFEARNNWFKDYYLQGLTSFRLVVLIMYPSK